MTMRNEFTHTALLVALALLVESCVGCDAPAGSGQAGSSQTSSSPEHAYAERRFKQEGYSDADSKKAAEAVVKFHNAQKNR